MRYQKIEGRIWHDEKFSRLTSSQQLLFLYILTCPHGNLTGCFVLKEGYACADLKSLAKDFQKDLRKLCESGLIRYDFDHEVLLIPKFLKHNPLTNPNQKKAALKTLNDLPKSPLLKHFLGLIEGLPKELGEVLLKPETETETDSEKRVCAPTGAPSPSNGRFQEFEIFWKSFPVKANRKSAFDRWKAMLKQGRLPPLANLLSALEAQTKTEKWKRDGIFPHASTWLNGERWNDEVPEDPYEKACRLVEEGQA